MRRWRLATASDPQLAGRAELRARPLRRLRHRGHPRRGRCGRRALYEGGTYAAERRAFAPLLEPLRRLAERDRLRFLAVGAARGRGCSRSAPATGASSRCCAAAGFEARGIEPSPSACEAAARIGAPVVNASARGGRRSTPAPEDAVVFWHALEHLADPASRRGPGSRVARARRPADRRGPGPGEPPGPDRRRPVVSPGRTAAPHPLHPGGPRSRCSSAPACGSCAFATCWSSRIHSGCGRRCSTVSPASATSPSA